MATKKLRPVQRTPLLTDLNKEIAIRELQDRVNQLVELLNKVTEKLDGAGLSV
jgi:hypothetical protein